MGWLRLTLRLPLVVLCVLATLFAMTIGGLAGAHRFNRRVMQLSFATGCLIVGLRVNIRGELSKSRPLLLISNHFSYLDLFAIGANVPAAFTPKSEIASWPVIGSLCKLAGCIFIDRRPTKTAQNKQTLEKAREEGEIISLFAEGTTNEGRSILPFRSSFFSLAEGTDLTVQPLSVIYTHINDQPMTRGAPLVGWYGDALFFPHLVQFLKQKNAEALLVFHPAVTGSQFATRKELAAYCREEVQKPFYELLPQVMLQ